MIIDYYNEYPHMVNVIDKMNEELSDLQKEINNLKDDLYMYPEYGRPKVVYNNEEGLNNTKKKVYDVLKQDIIRKEGIVCERTIKNVLYKLVPIGSEVKIRTNLGRTYEHDTLSNWVHWKSVNIIKYVNYSYNSLIKLNVELEKIYENIYYIITNEIDNCLSIGGNIVQYKCRKCGGLTDCINRRPFGDNCCGWCGLQELLFKI